jgi:hypothetical protein
MKNTNGISITNNSIYNTYRSAIVFTGKNNVLRRNLVTTIYWSGTAQPLLVAPFNMNFDAAIMSRNGSIVAMQCNLVAGAERVAYRIEGDRCPGAIVPISIYNSYSNNEAYSVMSGVNIWPANRGFIYDRRELFLP